MFKLSQTYLPRWGAARAPTKREIVLNFTRSMNTNEYQRDQVQHCEPTSKLQSAGARISFILIRYRITFRFRCKSAEPVYM